MLALAHTARVLPSREPPVFMEDIGSALTLPAYLDTPVIMVGPCTGIAPMRGFTQDRVASGSKNNFFLWVPQ